MIKRDLLPELKEHLSQKEISLIVGPRQAGKTTLMLLLKTELEKEGKRTLYFNLDVEKDKRLFTSQENFLEQVLLGIGKQEGYVFIDEIQRKENAGLFLKGIYDQNLPYKFIVSGSGSVELKEKIPESLVGRKRVFTLHPLSFKEFANFRTNYRYEDKLEKFLSLDSIGAKRILDEYLTFGGYPKVVLAQTLEEKRKMIDEIYQSYLERDIFYLLGIKKTEAFTNLVKILASQIGGLVNFFELSSTLGVSVKTVEHYLWYLQKTFIITKSSPFFKNVRKEITKSPIFYFTDLGLRNHALGEFGNLGFGEKTGLLFQNFVFQILEEQTRHQAAKVNFWRSRDGAEVDFIINPGQEVIPLEAKYQNLKLPEVSKSLRSFIAKYHPSKAFVVNLSLGEEAKANKTRILFVPFFASLKLI